MQMVKDWLHEIDSAAIRIAAAKCPQNPPGAASGPSNNESGAFEPMDEEELTEQLAEAAIPPAGSEEGAAEARARVVEEAKEGIRKKNLLAGKAVRKTISK